MNITFLAKIIISIMAFSCASAYAEKLVVHKDKEATLYVDTDAILKKDQDLYLVISVRDFNGKRIDGGKSATFVSWVDCESLEISNQVYKLNSGRMGKGLKLDQEVIEKINFHKPKESVKALVIKVCDLAKDGKFRNVEPE